QWARGTDQARDHVDVVLARAARGQRARTALEVAALDHPSQRLDLVLAERGGSRVHHLHAVVVYRVVAAGDVGPAVEPPVRGREIEHRRGDLADVDPAAPRRPRALDEP